MFSRRSGLINLSILGVWAFLISLCNPLHPFSKKLPGTDSSAYIYIGKIMSQGMVPYKDFFEHHGPINYLINWAGMKVGFVGVWFIELVGIAISILLCYKCAQRFFSEIASLFGTIVTFISLSSWYEGGNLTEVFAMPFFFGTLYCLTEYLEQNFELKSSQVFISGLCMGAVLMIRANMIGMWLGMCMVIFLHTLYIRKFKIAGRYILFFLLGVFAATTPFIVWYASKGALLDFYECYIQANMYHISNNSLRDRLGVVYNILSFPVVILAGIALIVEIFNTKPALDNYRYFLALMLAASLSFSIILAALSGYGFAHYYMALLPAIALPVTSAVEFAIKQKINIITLLMIISITLHASLAKWTFSFISTLRTNTQIAELATVVNENTYPNEPILSIGNCQIYLESGHPAATYYLYFAAGTAHPSIVEKYIMEISRNKPTIIIQTTFNIPANLTDYLNENYSMIYEIENAVIYKRL